MTQSTKIPEGYKKANIELAGFWNPKSGPIHGKVIGGFSFKNSKRRMTTVYMIHLKEPCEASVKLEGGGLSETTLKPGEVCGVFHSGDLHRLKNLYGCMVHITAKLDEDGEFITKTVPQGEMKLFDLRYKGEEKPVPIEVRASEPESKSSSQEAIDYPDSDDDIPF